LFNLELNKTYNIDCIDGLEQMIKQNLLVDCIISDPLSEKIIIQIGGK